jgi:hypothetical protein
MPAVRIPHGHAGRNNADIYKTVGVDSVKNRGINRVREAAAYGEQMR